MSESLISSQQLIANYQKVISHIEQGCQAHNRPTKDVSLLAVSKTKPASAVATLYQQGQRHFGENYLQDAQLKIEALHQLNDIQWHFIGDIQSNKTNIIAQHFCWVETLSRLKIAQRLQQQRSQHLPALNVLIQVNISGEQQKAGIAEDQVLAFAEQLQSFDRLKLRGLMCIPSTQQQTSTEISLEHQMRNMQKLMQQLQSLYTQCDTLSMGMSQDLDLAIQYGSTQVRIGTDIFGARQ